MFDRHGRAKTKRLLAELGRSSGGSIPNAVVVMLVPVLDDDEAKAVAKKKFGLSDPASSVDV